MPPRYCSRRAKWSHNHRVRLAISPEKLMIRPAAVLASFALPTRAVDNAQPANASDDIPMRERTGAPMIEEVRAVGIHTATLYLHFQVCGRTNGSAPTQTQRLAGALFASSLSYTSSA